MISMIKFLYDGSTSCVRAGGVNIQRFEITTGVRQGDVLSPVIFIIVVDWIMKRVIGDEDGIKWLGSDRVADLNYADDIALLS